MRSSKEVCKNSKTFIGRVHEKRKFEKVDREIVKSSLEVLSLVEVYHKSIRSFYAVCKKLVISS